MVDLVHDAMATGVFAHQVRGSVGVEAAAHPHVGLAADVGAAFEGWSAGAGLALWGWSAAARAHSWGRCWHGRFLGLECRNPALA